MRISELVITFVTLAGIAAIAAVYMGRLSLAAAIDIGMLLACLIWLFFLVKIPWDLYFATRKARVDGQESQRLGIEGVKSKTDKLMKLEGYLLTGALSGHLLTAAGIYALGNIRLEVVSQEFSWLFVASAALRPAWEGYGYLRQRIQEMASEVRYPREDVNTLRSRVTELQNHQKEVSRQLSDLDQQLSLRIQKTDAVTRQLQSQQIEESARHEKQIVQLSHRFEEVVEQLSSDQALLAGVRAFARMLREPKLQ